MANGFHEANHLPLLPNKKSYTIIHSHTKLDTIIDRGKRCCGERPKLLLLRAYTFTHSLYTEIWNKSMVQNCVPALRFIMETLQYHLKYTLTRKTADASTTLVRGVRNEWTGGATFKHTNKSRVQLSSPVYLPFASYKGELSKVLTLFLSLAQ